MSELKRDLVKYIRDFSKARYQKGSSCEICGATENLDFHHFYSLAELVRDWLKSRQITNVDKIELANQLRAQFVEEHHKEVYDETVTLCHDHHQKLHSIYGRNPRLSTAKKQAAWVEKQRAKNGLV